MPFRSAEKQPSAYERLFGTEKSRFTEGIRRRREQETTKPSDFFFDPATTEVSTPAAMMTRYLAKGIPDKAARLAASQEFIDRMGMYGPTAKTMAEMFTNRFPRIAAHMSPTMATLEKGIHGITGAGVRSPVKPLKNPVIFNTEQDAPNLLETMFHEGTHVAQELGLASKGGIGPTYKATEKALNKLGIKGREAYNLNPSEWSARSGGRRKMGSKEGPARMGPMLDKLVEMLPPGSSERIELGQLRLDRRGNK